jgi:hypothetical protein
MNPLSIYRAKGKTIGLVFLFKYDLKGNLKAFEISEGELNDDQQNWLYSQEHFPATEAKMKYWQKTASFTKIFEVERSPADISFDAFWKAYPPNPLSKKWQATQKFQKLTEADKIKLFINLPEYIKLKQKENTMFPYAEVFINQRWWDR